LLRVEALEKVHVEEDTLDFTMGGLPLPHGRGSVTLIG
jgi:hypothetical protein